jgi:NAD(P)-dependent dehydrogenase (short-subunit alcohol dehydrogenase family)
MSMVAAELLRPGLLAGTTLVVVGSAGSSGEPGGESFGHAVCTACEQLGSCVNTHVHGDAVEETAMDAAVTAAIVASGSIDMLIVDGASLFVSYGLRACLHSAWDATRAVVNLAFLPATRGGAGRGRRIVYLAPPPRAGEHADAARAGLENLARTLSVEWARHNITPVAVALGDTTMADEVAALTAYLASPAAAYLSGCLLDLRGV